MLHPGDHIDGYVVDSLAGRGGSAQVFLAHRDTPDGVRRVALKVLDSLQINPENTDRLHREFELAARLCHPRVVAMYDSGDHWIAMEAVDGGSAMDLVSVQQDWIIEVKLRVLQQIAGALDYVHSQGIVHCDVKPTNILRRRTGEAVLTDFGVAQELIHADGPRRPVVRTSLPYAAPEVLRGMAVSPSTDQYALACTAVELFDGKPPFTARTTMKLMDLHLHASPWPISYRRKLIPRAFDPIVGRAMSKDPRDRYPTCSEFVTLLTHTFT